MLRRLLQALWGPPAPLPPRVRDLVERLDALEGGLSGLRRRVSTLEGQLTGGRRRNAHSSEPEPPELEHDVPDPDQLEISAPPATPTAHLARRFRSF